MKMKLICQYHFLDLLISWNNKNFTTTVYRKSTFSGVWSFFDSFVADEYKHRLTLKLPFWIFSKDFYCSEFHEEAHFSKDVLIFFPTYLVGIWIKMLLNKWFSHKKVKHTVPKKKLFIVLPYFMSPSLF